MTRDEAINLLDNMLGMVQDNHGSDYDMAIHMAIDALKQPERKTGEWINRWSGDGSAWLEQKCSECGIVFEDEPNDYNFCPVCGADMREQP